MRLLALEERNAVLLILVLTATGTHGAALRRQLAEQLHSTAELLAEVRADLAWRRSP